MSTFIQLVQDLHTGVGAAGVVPQDVVNVSGESARLANWIKQADNYIQLKWVNWKFLRKLYSVPTVASIVTASKPQNLKYWDFKSFFLIEPGQTQRNPISAVEYDKIKADVLDTSSDIPARVIVMPDNSLKFEPIPDAAYTIEADYYDRPTLMAAKNDVSLIPEEYHQVIIGRAMILYANFENAPEIKEQGSEIYIEQLALLENDQLPNLMHSRFNTGATIEVIAE